MAEALLSANVVPLKMLLILQEFFDEDDLDDMPHLESVPPNDTMEPKVDYYDYLIINNSLLILITKCLHILSFALYTTLQKCD